MRKGTSHGDGLGIVTGSFFVDRTVILSTIVNAGCESGARGALGSKNNKKSSSSLFFLPLPQLPKLPEKETKNFHEGTWLLGEGRSTLPTTLQTAKSCKHETD